MRDFVRNDRLRAGNGCLPGKQERGNVSVFGDGGGACGLAQLVV